MKKLLAVLLVVMMFIGACNSKRTAPAVEASGTIGSTETQSESSFAVIEEKSISLNGSGSLTFRFTELLKEEFAEKVDRVYLREVFEAAGREAPKAPAESDLIAVEKYTVTPSFVTLNSDLVKVMPGKERSYELILMTSDTQQMIYKMNVKNIRPTTFTVRLLNKNGGVVKRKEYTYDEMIAMADKEAYYSGGCVMSGMFNFKAKGVRKVQPDIGRAMSGRSLADGNFVFVVGEHKFCRSCMDIKGDSQMAGGYGRTLQVKRRPDISPFGTHAKAFS